MKIRRISISFILILALLTLCKLSFAFETAWVHRVIDGDTLLLVKGKRVRLLGVDTPETKHPRKQVQRFGKEAYLFTKNLVEGKEVFLEYDWQKNDKYGRVLAYVYLKDGTLVNAEIIRQGYGFAYTRHPYKRMEEFRRLEREARENRRGLWAVASSD